MRGRGKEREDGKKTERRKERERKRGKQIELNVLPTTVCVETKS